MSSDLERLPARVLPTAFGVGPLRFGGGGPLLGRARAELPVIGELGEREQVLVAA